MNAKLLTIVIPTYNRAQSLGLLLATLAQELQGLEQEVDVVIGDNASNDETPQVTGKFQQSYGAVTVLRHSRNVGAEENFCLCLETVRSRHFWIIGDDDLPKAGTVKQVVALLRNHAPDLLHLSSEWQSRIESLADGTSVPLLSAVQVSRDQFAQMVNVWLTFISGMVVNLERLHALQPAWALRRFHGTQLVQLGWVLPMLMSGNTFHIVPQRCVLAKAENSGGYKIIEVFGKTFPQVVGQACGPQSVVAKAVTFTLAWTYIPLLVWRLRFRGGGNYKDEHIGDSVAFLKRSVGYWLCILPVLLLPKPLAALFMAPAKLYPRFNRVRLRLLGYAHDSAQR